MLAHIIVVAVAAIVAAVLITGALNGPTVGDLVEKEMREGTWERETGQPGQE